MVLVLQTFPGFSFFILFYMVMREGDELKLSRSGRENKTPMFCLLVVFTDLSSCSTGRQRRVWSPQKRSISLYSLEGKTQRSNVHANRCLSARSRYGAWPSAVPGVPVRVQAKCKGEI